MYLITVGTRTDLYRYMDAADTSRKIKVSTPPVVDTAVNIVVSATKIIINHISVIFYR